PAERSPTAAEPAACPRCPAAEPSGRLLRPPASPEQQRERAGAAAGDQQSDDHGPRHRADAPVSLLGVELARLAVRLQLGVVDLRHPEPGPQAAGSAIVSPKCAGRVSADMARSSAAVYENTPCSSRVGSVSVTPMRATG